MKQRDAKSQMKFVKWKYDTKTEIPLKADWKNWIRKNMKQIWKENLSHETDTKRRCMGSTF